MLPTDDILLDRLVDGELSPAERRELLASLDGRPDGWRRCALAFLEAQTWRGELPQLVAEATSSPRQTSVEEVPLEPEWTMNWYTIAASLLFAFTMGLAFRDLPHSHQTRTPIPSNIATIRPRHERSASQLATIGPATVATGRQRDRCGSATRRAIRDSLRVPLVDATAMDQHLGLRVSVRACRPTSAISWNRAATRSNRSDAMRRLCSTTASRWWCRWKIQRSCR